ncbi:hypothetical protein FoTM2_014613 [Fusarium oxysporum f. sp. vasinfectum]|nr:hypothetical protein FoTM2_014613 [Fusarium oxysporum f. sp. vasinfectum]
MTELGDQFLEWVQKSIHALGGLRDDLTRNPTTVAPGGISYVATSYEGLEKESCKAPMDTKLAGLGPSDPTTRDRSTAAVERDQHMKLVMQDIGNHSSFSTEVPGWAALSTVLSQVFDSEDVIFVAVISHRRADDLLGIKIFPGVDTSVVPIRAYLD